MTNLTPVSRFDDVPRIETSTKVLGGPIGPANGPTQALLNRTQWLNDQLGTIADEAAAAASGYATEAQDSATNAAASAASAAASDSDAITQAAAASAAASSAITANDAAQLSAGIYATTAKALSNGVKSLASLVAGTGGTNGTFSLAFSGGAGSGASGTFTVAGGAVVSTAINYGGDSYTSAPTVSFAASSGLTGASATAVISANVPAGKYFSVPSAGANDYLDLWQNVAGVATATGKTYPSSVRVAALDAQVQPIAAAFDFTPSKNLYNPALAQDGLVTQPSTGADTVLATSIISGHIPVQEGKTYTLSQPSSEAGFYGHIFCYNAAGAYLGMDASISGSTAIPGINFGHGAAGATGGYPVITFTIPIGSGIATVSTYMLFNYAAHTTADFDRIRNATQMELGPVATAFSPFGTPPIATPKESSIPAAIQRTAPVAPVLAAFDYTPSRNLYNLANAIDGNTLNYATGLSGVYAPGMTLGYFPVIAGQTYTVSMTDPLGFHSDHPIFCRNASGTFLGVDHTIGGVTGMASPPTGVTWIGNNTVTFTIPVGSAIAFVGFSANYSVGHVTADFNRVVATVQAEVGTVVTGYQPYSPGGIAMLKASSAPVVLPTGVQRVGNDLYVLGAFDATSDIVQMISLMTGPNNTVNYMGARKAAKGSANPLTAWLGGSLLTVQGDSAAPLNYSGTFIGANHGANMVQAVVANAHGKTVQDVGSEWTDGAAIKWYLMQVIDVNNLWIMPQPPGAYPQWTTYTPALTGNLTHSSGATNTATITVGSSALVQLSPSLKNQTYRVLLDGITEITGDGIYRCNFLDVVNRYDIANPASVLTFVRSKVGGATQPSFIDPAVDADVHRTLTYRYAENGSCTIIDGVKVLNTFGYMGFFPATQAAVATYTGKQLWHYVPRVTPIVGSLKTWDFAAQEEIDGAMEQISYTNANWSDANNPPDRSAQIVKTAGVAEFGLMIGVSPVRSVGLPATRKVLTTSGGFVSAARKQYIEAVTDPAASVAGSYYETVAFRALWSANSNPDATCFTWYRDGKAIIVVADFHQNVSLSPLVLPQQFVGMDVAVVDKTPSASVQGNGVVTADGILVTVTGGYGYVVLRLN